jgi:hypothetical protein
LPVLPFFSVLSFLLVLLFFSLCTSSGRVFTQRKVATQRCYICVTEMLQRRDRDITDVLQSTPYGSVETGFSLFFFFVVFLP